LAAGASAVAEAAVVVAETVAAAEARVVGAVCRPEESDDSSSGVAVT